MRHIELENVCLRNPVRVRVAFAILVSCAFGFMSSTSSACTTLEITNVVTATLSPSENPVSVEFDVRKTGPACAYFLTVDKGMASSYDRVLSQGADQIRYNLYVDQQLTRVLKDASDAVGSEVVTGSFSAAGDQTQRITFYASRSSDTLRPPGNYSDTLGIHLYQGAFSAAAIPSDTKALNINYFVAPMRELSLVGLGQAFNSRDKIERLSFGELTTGKTLGFDLVVRANADYVVRVSSRNGGRMKHARRDQFIDYQLRVDGTTKSLNNGRGSSVEVARQFGISPESGYRHPFKVVVGAVESALSGQYSDQVTITVESN